jgi:hypothetical protein
VLCSSVRCESGREQPGGSVAIQQRVEERNIRAAPRHELSACDGGIDGLGTLLAARSPCRRACSLRPVERLLSQTLAALPAPPQPGRLSPTLLTKNSSVPLMSDTCHQSPRHAIDCLRQRDDGGETCTVGEGPALQRLLLLSRDGRSADRYRPGAGFDKRPLRCGSSDAQLHPSLGGRSDRRRSAVWCWQRVGYVLALIERKSVWMPSRSIDPSAAN